VDQLEALLSRGRIVNVTTDMVVLLGARGYVGQAFAHALRQRGWPFAALSRKEINYTRFDVLWRYLKSARPSFLINAAGFTGTPNVDACETARAETLQGNVLFPQSVAQACLLARLPWGHVSSGCIYSGAKIISEEGVRIERDLMPPDLQVLVQKQPEAVHGYTETDPPNFSFRAPPCSFYSGAKALAEEALAEVGQCYLWRLRIPFDQFDHPRNYLTKLQRYAKVYNNINSLSHRGDFARACLDLWERRAPFGTYNMTNPGFITTRQVVAMIQRKLTPRRHFEFWANDDEFYRLGAKTPRSNCVLDVTKLLTMGVQLRPVEEALEDALQQWTPESMCAAESAEA
jgi:dTDP-4-dehydrorhamnose reductase